MSACERKAFHRTRDRPTPVFHFRQTFLCLIPRWSGDSQSCSCHTWSCNAYPTASVLRTERFHNRRSIWPFAGLFARNSLFCTQCSRMISGRRHPGNRDMLSFLECRPDKGDSSCRKGRSTAWGSRASFWKWGSSPHP